MISNVQFPISLDHRDRSVLLLVKFVSMAVSRTEYLASLGSKKLAMWNTRTSEWNWRRSALLVAYCISFDPNCVPWTRLIGWPVTVVPEYGRCSVGTKKKGGTQRPHGNSILDWLAPDSLPCPLANSSRRRRESPKKKEKRERTKSDD